MNTELFFAVWDLPELRSLIRSFMWPGRRSATWYKYRDLVAACANGYTDLVLARCRSLSGDWDSAAAAALLNGHLSTVERLINVGAVNSHDDAIEPSLHKKYTIAAASLGYASITRKYIKCDFVKEVVDAAADNGHIRVLICTRLQYLQPPELCANAEIANWVAHNYSGDAVHSLLPRWLYDAANFGRQDILEWASVRYPNKELPKSLPAICARHGHTKALKWLLLRREFAQSSILNLIAEAASSGHESTVRFLHRLVCAKKEVRDLSHSRVINWAIAGAASVELIEWMWGAGYGRELERETVMAAARRGDISIMQWVLDHSSEDGAIYIRKALSRGRLKLAMWLIDKYSGGTSFVYTGSSRRLLKHANKSELMRVLNSAALSRRLLNKAIHYGYLHAAMAMCEHYKCGVDLATVEIAIRCGHIETAEWARKTFALAYTWNTFICAAESRHLHVVEYVLANIPSEARENFSGVYNYPTTLGTRLSTVNEANIPERARAFAVFAAIDRVGMRECGLYEVVRYLCEGYKLTCQSEMLDLAYHCNSYSLINWLCKKPAVGSPNV